MPSATAPPMTHRGRRAGTGMSPRSLAIALALRSRADRGLPIVPLAELGAAGTGSAPTDVASADGHRQALAGTRPTFTITDAAAACAVSRKTITAQARRPRRARCRQGRGRGVANPCRGVARGRPASGPVRTCGSPSIRPAAAASHGDPALADLPGPPGAAPQAGPELRQRDHSRDRWDDLRLRLARAEAEAAERALALADASGWPCGRSPPRRLPRRRRGGIPVGTGPEAAQAPNPQSRDLGQGGPPVPPAAGWVMSAQRPGSSEGATGLLVVPDPGLAPACDRNPATAPQTALVADIGAMRGGSLT